MHFEGSLQKKKAWNGTQHPAGTGNSFKLLRPWHLAWVTNPSDRRIRCMKACLHVVYYIDPPVQDHDVLTIFKCQER
jgi:hypothetical protein